MPPRSVSKASRASGASTVRTRVQPPSTPSRRSVSKVTRASGASTARVPVKPSYTTPLSSAYPSTCASETEWDQDDVSQIPISALSLQDSPTGTTGAHIHASAMTRKKRSPVPFRFMDLPPELRVKVYGFHFADVGRVVDLDSDNYRRIHKKLGILRVSRSLYSEASYFFYSTHTFRIFPTCPGRFFKTKKPLLARFTPRQRACISSLELRLGPGWNKPPRGWVVNPALGLADCVNVRLLTVFVECDPSDGVFNGFRRADGFYEKFSQTLLKEVLAELPFLESVHFDAWSSVKKAGAMMRGLVEATVAQRRKICWGPERGWADADDEEEVKPMDAVMGLATGSNVIVVA